MKKPRLYLDTSVFGGCFDKEFETGSNQLLSMIKQSKFQLLISDIVLRELENAPKNIKDILLSIEPANIEFVDISAQIIELSELYIKNKILSKKWNDDALHVACATIARADAIVSWNFKHIVRFDKIKAFNSVNILNGYGFISIVTPMEVTNYD